MLKVIHELEDPELGAATRRRGLKRRIAAGAAIVLAVLVVVAGALYWQLTRSSIRLAFLSGRVEATLAERLPAGSRVRVGSTAIAYRDAEGVVLRLRDIQVSLPGTAAVSADELLTATNPGVLFGGRIALSSVKVSGLSIGVSRSPTLDRDGSAADRIREAVVAFMDQVVKADTIMRDAGLREMTVSAATVSFDEGLSAPAIHIGSANWLPLAEGRSKAWIQMVEEGGGGWDLTVERREAGDGQSTVTVEIEDLPTTTLSPRLAGADGSPYFRSLITLQARMARAANGAFLGLRGVVSAAEGSFSMNGEDEVHVDTAALSFILEPTGNRLSFPSADIRTRSGRMLLEGVADLADPDNVTVVSRVRGGRLPTPIGEPHTVDLVGGGGLARLDLSSLGINIERFDLVTPEGSASVIGQASLGGETPGLSFALSINPMPARVMRALWPPFVATKTRTWFDMNVKAGMVGPATLTVALPPDHIGIANRGKVLPSTALVGTLPFQDAVFTPISTFLPIRNALGGITFGNATASIWAQTGVLDVPGKGEIQAGGTTLIIPELGRLRPRGDLHLELAGPAAALASASNTPPLQIAAKQGIDPDALTGAATLALDANIPIYESDFTDVIPNFRLALTDFSSKKPIEGRSIEKANLVLEGSPKSYTVKGLGKLDGFDAAVDLILGTAAPDTSAVTVELDAEARKRLGFSFGNLLSGPVLASLTHSDEPRQQVALDLKQARISLPFLGWEKGPGVPATASFVMEKTSAGTEVSSFVLSGKGFEARGALSIAPDGRVRKIVFDKVALRAGDQLSATVTAHGDGFDVTVRGASLDARGLIKNIGSGMTGSGADIFPVQVSVDVEVVKGQNDVALTNVSGTMTVTSKGIDAVSLKGFTGSDQPFEWIVKREGKTRIARLFADGGGALIRFSGIYSRIAGGNLVVDYSGPIDGTGKGVALMRDFRLVNEDAIADVIRNTSSRGPRDDYVPQTTDLHFGQLKIPFTQKGWVIAIDDAALRGSTLGATASGTINVPDGKMALSGTFIPAFGLNNIAGSIPILGAILGGGRDEGLVGITYKMFGPLDNPTLVMNPISAIAPGIFRKIFEYR